MHPSNGHQPKSKYYHTQSPSFEFQQQYGPQYAQQQQQHYQKGPSSTKVSKRHTPKRGMNVHAMDPNEYDEPYPDPNSSPHSNPNPNPNSNPNYGHSTNHQSHYHQNGGPEAPSHSGSHGRRNQRKRHDSGLNAQRTQSPSPQQSGGRRRRSRRRRDTARDSPSSSYPDSFESPSSNINANGNGNHHPNNNANPNRYSSPHRTHRHTPHSQLSDDDPNDHLNGGYNSSPSQHAHSQRNGNHRSSSPHPNHRGRDKAKRSSSPHPNSRLTNRGQRQRNRDQDRNGDPNQEHSNAQRSSSPHPNARRTNRGRNDRRSRTPNPSNTSPRDDVYAVQSRDRNNRRRSQRRDQKSSKQNKHSVPNVNRQGMHQEQRLHGNSVGVDRHHNSTPNAAQRGSGAVRQRRNSRKRSAQHSVRSKNGRALHTVRDTEATFPDDDDEKLTLDPMHEMDAINGMNGNQLYPMDRGTESSRSPSPALGSSGGGGRRKEMNAKKRRHTTTPNESSQGNGTTRRKAQRRKGSARTPRAQRGRRQRASKSPAARGVSKEAKLNKGKLAEKFTIKEKLGRGNFSVVRKVIRKEDGKTFAAKIISTKTMSQQEIKDTHDEVDILAKVESI